uniref:Putative secreted protein n=1 Tax=Anopheles darlingi TaxID=43151 RepID=A0A2M4DF17_ANODA
MHFGFPFCGVCVCVCVLSTAKITPSRTYRVVVVESNDTSFPGGRCTDTWSGGVVTVVLTRAQWLLNSRMIEALEMGNAIMTTRRTIS